MRRLIPTLLLALLAPAVRADVKPHALFSDGMVLQQKVKCPVWGTAAPGESVRVSVEKPGEALSVGILGEADKQGRWRVNLDAREAGGPFTLKIEGKTTVTVKDVYFGEVWVASGQSNMQWSIDASETPAWVKRTATNKMIRFFTVPHRPADGPQTDVGAKWVVSSPEAAGAGR
jgi:sialate O-acetylesterase